MVPHFDAFGDYGLLIVFLERVQSPQSKWNEAGGLTVQEVLEILLLETGLQCNLGS